MQVNNRETIVVSRLGVVVTSPESPSERRKKRNSPITASESLSIFEDVNLRFSSVATRERESWLRLLSFPLAAPSVGVCVAAYFINWLVRFFWYVLDTGMRNKLSCSLTMT